MPARPDVFGLLEQMLDEGRTPEEVCREHPEMLSEVRERWRAFRLIDAEVDALLPEHETTLEKRSKTPVGPTGTLPRIPGYDVQSVLGHGGIGVVYKAQHLRSHRTVAMKMLLSGEYASETELARFQREVEAVASLRHPNIVQIYDVADHDGRPFYTMEFVEGGNLARKLDGAPLPARDAAVLVATLAEAVDAAHRSGIIHRDLKPGNVLMTADGQPKISDFGLARRIESDPQFTQSGVPIGTPSYMAPEQAQGKSSAIGPASDTYALGAILYQLLTGQPPFTGETSAETVLQVIAHDPAPPSHLNDKLPRDLEIICLKCLRKEQQFRYESAGALAEDLHRFVRGEAIAARPEGRIEKLARKVRRRPSVAIGLTAGALLAAVLGVGWVWLNRERAANELATQELERVNQARRDQEFAARLDAIRLNRTAIFDGTSDSAANARLNKIRADANYETAFRDVGFAVFDDQPEQIAARLAASEIYGPLAVAFDDWAACALDQSRRDRLLDIAMRAGLDRTGLRRKLRDPAVWTDRVALTDLAWKSLEEKRSTRLLVLLGERLRDAGGDAVPFLRVAQQQYPDDFWINFVLGDSLWATNAAEAVRYYQAALALRPNAAVVHNNLGRALAYAGRMDEAIVELRVAIDKEPQYAHAHSNLGLALNSKRLHDEALKHFEFAVQYGPQHAETHLNLGVGLVALNRMEEAEEMFRKAIQINPNLATAHSGLGKCLREKGQLDSAIQHYQTAVRFEPRVATNHSNLGYALMEKGRAEESVQHLQEAIRLGADDDGARMVIGKVFAESGRTDAAVEQFQKAIELEPNNAKAHYNLGLTYAESGRYDDALGPLERAIRLDPDLAEAHGRIGGVYSAVGRFSEARTSILRCLELLPPDDRRRPTLLHAVKRCERWLALEPRLPAVLAGQERPAGAAETLEFVEIAQAKKKYRDAVRLYELSEAADPKQPGSLPSRLRYVAAECAAAAGCGRGEDGAKADNAERARWRGQALSWLRAELSRQAGILDSDDPSSAGRVKKSLSYWQKDVHLAGVREPEALAALPLEERELWTSLWSEVNSVIGRAGKPE